MVMKRLHRVETAFQSVAEDEERVRAREFARALVDAIFAVPEAKRGMSLVSSVWREEERQGLREIGPSRLIQQGIAAAIASRSWTPEERGRLDSLEAVCRSFFEQ
ncbi:MAG: hypothetical protein HY688_00370 [Chloroflexi bacterium]|nr:hypothetical protein [Chloroflexota bacterium]